MRYLHCAMMLAAALGLLLALALPTEASDPRPLLSLEGGPAMGLDPNGTAAFTLTLAVLDGGGLATIALEGAPEGWTFLIAAASPNATGGPNGTVRLSLGPDSPVVVTVTLTAPRYPLAGDYPMALRASVDGSPLTDALALTVTVARTYLLILSFDAPEASALPGDVVEFMGQVRSRGNCPDEARLECVRDPSGWGALPTPALARLDALGGAIVSFRIAVPLEFASAPARTHTFEVRATSAGGGVWSTAVLRLALRDFHRVEWALNGSALTGLDAPEARLGDVTLNPRSADAAWQATGLGLLGMGNAPANVTLEVTTSPDGLEVEAAPARCAVPQWGGLDVSLRVRAPGAAPAGTYLVHLNASCDGGGMTRRALLVEVVVVRVDLNVASTVNVTGPTVVADCCNNTATVVLGNNVTLSCVVLNIGTADVADATLRLLHRTPAGGPLREVQAFRVEVARDDVAQYTWNLSHPEAGSHYFEFVLELAGQSATDNDNATLVLFVSEPIAPPAAGGPASCDPPTAAYASVSTVAAMAAAVTWLLLARSRRRRVA